MAKYIPLDALLAEIERRIKTNKECMLGLRNLDYYQGKVDALNDTNSFIDTLEMKEVCLDEETLHSELRKIYASVYDSKDIEAAKHFFELGLNASNQLTWEDVKLIWNIGDEIPYMPEEDFFKEILKRFKAQKGEKV